MKEYIHQASCKIVLNKLQKIGIKSIHIKWINEIMKELIIKLLHISYKIYEHNLFIKWMNEIIKNYIRQASCRIVVNKLQKVLTYVIH
jgi:hypothetical protein